MNDTQFKEIKELLTSILNAIKDDHDWRVRENELINQLHDEEQKKIDLRNEVLDKKFGG